MRKSLAKTVRKHAEEKCKTFTHEQYVTLIEHEIECIIANRLIAECDRIVKGNGAPPLVTGPKEAYLYRENRPLGIEAVSKKLLEYIDEWKEKR